MPTNLIEADVFTDPIAVPVDADPANAASVVVPFQGLANRTRNLKNYCTSVGVQLPGPVTHTKRYGPASCVFEVPASWTRTEERVRSETNLARTYVDLSDLPRAGSILRVRVLVDPGIARATVTDRIRVALFRHEYGASYAAPSTAIPLVIEARDDGTANLQWVLLDLSSAPEVVSVGAAWTVEVLTGIDSGANKDLVYALAVEFNADTVRSA